MSQELTNINTQNVSDFVKQMAAMRGGSLGNNAGPRVVRLDGNTGLFVQKVWNKEENKSEVKQLKTPFQGTVLLYRYFVQWKFGTAADGQKIQSREFSNMDSDPIELLRIDYNQNKTESLGSWSNYKAFKEAKKQVDTTTGKESYPFDFWCTLYVYIHESDEIIRLKFKGDSRSAWFDYNSAYRRDMDVADIVELITEFSSVKEEMAKSASQAEAKSYYRASFKTLRKSTVPELQKIMEATLFLGKWMQSFEKEEMKQEENIVASGYVEPKKDEIDISSIPF